MGDPNDELNESGEMEFEDDEVNESKEEMASSSESSDDEEDDNEEEEEEDENDRDDDKRRVYLPGQPMEDGEELVCDESAYVMYHKAQTAAPCLSFDILHDDLGDNRETFPLTCYLVAGTQAEKSQSNEVIVIKMSNMNQVKVKENKDDEEDSSSDEEENEAHKAKLEAASISHQGAVNRIRSTLINQEMFAATWSENGKVYIWNLTKPLCAINDAKEMAKYNKDKQLPVYTFAGHKCEGFAMDWSRLKPGRLATGDCSKNIYIWDLQEGGTWAVNPVPFAAHSESVEDIQWSPNDENWFASCSVDKSIRIWDVRIAPHKGSKVMINPAHDSDVNVISWNRLEAQYIASGGDDGIVKIWDIRRCKDKPLSAMPTVGEFSHHKGAITSIEWNPFDSSVLAAAGEDNQVTLWDIAMEREDRMAEEPDIPPELLFIHMGQEDIKELHWHPQLPGVVVSTALSDFNIFRTISV